MRTRTASDSPSAIPSAAASRSQTAPPVRPPGVFVLLSPRGIAPIAPSRIGSPGRPERDRTPEDTVDLEDPVIVNIANRLGVHPAVVCVKWACQLGATPIPFS